MLTTVFLYCAVIGTVIILCQFAMTLLGMDDGGGDVDAGFDGDVGVDADFDADGGGHTDSSWLFGVISFRTFIAFLAFFGLGGSAAMSAGQTQMVSLIIAFGCGAAAMYGVFALLQAIYKLQADGTRRIQNAMGARGSVLVPIPSGNSGVGKIQIRMQGRLVELPAMTAGEDKLGTSTRIEVVEVLGPGTVRVEPIVEVVHASDPQDAAAS
jgi:hypothetical protein